MAIVIVDKQVEPGGELRLTAGAYNLILNPNSRAFINDANNLTRIVCDTSAGAIILYLPSIASMQRLWGIIMRIVKTTADPNLITVNVATASGDRFCSTGSPDAVVSGPYKYADISVAEDGLWTGLNLTPAP